MNTAVKPCCPTCGQAVQDAPRLDELCVALGLSGNIKRLFNVLSAARGRYLTTSEIAEIMWGDAENGGPDLGADNIRTYASRLRTILAGYPIKLELYGRSARFHWHLVTQAEGCGYQLERIAA